jgi:hypothetical protein
MSVTNKARRTIPKLSKELSSAITAGGVPRPATALVPASRSQDASSQQALLHTSSSSSNESTTDLPTLRPEQLAAVVREAGFAPQVQATLAAICAYVPLQEALREAIQANRERDSLSLAEGVMSSIAKGALPQDSAEDCPSWAGGPSHTDEDRDGCHTEKGKEREGRPSSLREEVESACSATSLRDYDHYKLKTHSFNEYRSEQDIASLLQVEEELNGSGHADDWRETSIGARSDVRSREDIHDGGRGHAGEPGAVDDESWMFSAVLFLAVTVVSLGFLYVGNKEVYRTALQSEMVKAAVALSQVWAASGEFGATAQ